MNIAELLDKTQSVKQEIDEVFAGVQGRAKGREAAAEARKAGRTAKKDYRKSGAAAIRRRMDDIAAKMNVMAGSPKGTASARYFKLDAQHKSLKQQYDNATGQISNLGIQQAAQGAETVAVKQPVPGTEQQTAAPEQQAAAAPGAEQQAAAPGQQAAPMDPALTAAQTENAQLRQTITALQQEIAKYKPTGG